MLDLTKENIISYLQNNYPAFDTSGQLKVAAVGEDDGDIEGIVNFIFRVTNKTRSIIIKQARAFMRMDRARNLDMESRPRLPESRNYTEYASLRMRSVIAPQYVPEVYHVDQKNHLFIMEDVSYIKPSRSIFSKNMQIPAFGSRCAEFLCDIHFYTSEFYLETALFRDMAAAFTSTEMRRIMEQVIFLRDGDKDACHPLIKQLQPIAYSPEIMTHSHLMRHKYMCCTEAMIHSDPHIFNIFADADHLKVIDMEYTFAGPIAYDLGYLISSLLSQYCTAAFRPFPSEGERNAFKQYMLSTVYDLIHGYIVRFAQHWNEEAKPVYRAQSGFRDAFLEELIPDIAGYCAMPMFNTLLNDIGLAMATEFATMKGDDTAMQHSMELYFALACKLLLGREKIRSPEAFLQTILETEQDYMAKVPNKANSGSVVDELSLARLRARGKKCDNDIAQKK